MLFDALRDALPVVLPDKLREADADTDTDIDTDGLVVCRGSRVGTIEVKSR